MKHTIEDYQAIEHLLRYYYLEGAKQADSSIMAPAFSPVATMYSVNEENHLSGGAVTETLFPEIDNHFMISQNPKMLVTSIDIVGTAASARVDANGMSDGSIHFTDFFHLLKIDGKWRIVSKIFQGR